MVSVLYFLICGITQTPFTKSDLIMTVALDASVAFLASLFVLCNL